VQFSESVIFFGRVASVWAYGLLQKKKGTYLDWRVPVFCFVGRNARYQAYSVCGGICQA